MYAFGSVFSNLTLIRTDSPEGTGTEQQRMVVPIQYGPKERWYTRLVTDPNFSQGVSQVVPALSFEIKGINYDTSRKLISLSSLTFPTAEQRQLARLYVGVPYTLTFQLSLLVKIANDGLQIVEQILPMFTPDVTLAINVFPDLGLIDQVPLTLVGVNSSDDYEGNFEKIRSIVWDLSFTMKVNFYGQKRPQARIEEVLVDFYNAGLGDLSQPSTVIETEDNQNFETEDGSGLWVTENTSNTYLTTGRVARADIVANFNQDPGATGEIESTTTLTEWDGDVIRSRTDTNVDETA